MTQQQLLVLDDWQRQAIKQIDGLGKLTAGWDGYGGLPPTDAVRGWAIDLIAGVHLGNLAAPQFGPIAHGGLQIDWWSGHKRELELHVEPDLTISFLRVEAGAPLDEGSVLPTGDSSVNGLLTWLRRG